jgi:hypothetical protein
MAFGARFFLLPLKLLPVSHQPPTYKNLTIYCTKTNRLPGQIFCPVFFLALLILR